MITAAHKIISNPKHKVGVPGVATNYFYFTNDFGYILRVQEKVYGLTSTPQFSDIRAMHFKEMDGN